MTFDDDFIRVPLLDGMQPINLAVAELGLSWPPPERVIIAVSDDSVMREPRDGDSPHLIMRQISCSAITDEERAEMTHVCRGAEYKYERDLDVE